MCIVFQHVVEKGGGVTAALGNDEFKCITAWRGNIIKLSRFLETLKKCALIGDIINDLYAHEREEFSIFT